MKGVRLVSCLVAAIVIAACGSGSGSSTNVIKLGAILSITGAGGVYGPQSRDGMNLAVKQINAAGGVNGAKIQLTINDDASDKAQASQLAQKLIQQEQDLALLGPTLSNSAVGAHPLAEGRHNRAGE
jgi:branched-chain amino acid transport system substrate-binding protein